jgi:hypothetical protein
MKKRPDLGAVVDAGERSNRAPKQRQRAVRGRSCRYRRALQSRLDRQKDACGSRRSWARSGATPASHRLGANFSKRGSAAARDGRRRSPATRIGPGARSPAGPVAGLRSPAGSTTWPARHSLRRGARLRSPACGGRFEPRRPAACQHRVLRTRLEYRSASGSARGDLSNPLLAELRLDDRRRPRPRVVGALTGRRSDAPAAKARDATPTA